MYQLGVTCDLFPVLRIYDPSNKDHLLYQAFILLNKKEHRMDKNKIYNCLDSKKKRLKLKLPK